MAERQTLVNIEYVSDHSCGTYRVGEIDTLTEDGVRKYVNTYGEYGYQEILDLCAGMVTHARNTIIAKRMNDHVGASCDASQ